MAASDTYLDGLESASLERGTWKKFFDGLSGVYLFEVAPIIDQSFTGELVPLIWAELALDTGTYVFAKVDLPDPATYYGGFKEARILSVGAIERALSDRLGNYEAAQFQITFTDADRRLRGLLGSNASKWFLNRFVTLRMISDENRRELKIPRVVGIGYLRDYAPISPLQFAITCEDYLAIFVGLGQNDQQIPKRLLSRTDFPTLATERIGLPVPICYGMLTDNTTATVIPPPPVITVSPGGYIGSDGGWVAGFGVQACSAVPPASSTLVASAGTPGLLSADVPNAEYAIIVTSVDAAGVESDPFPFSWNYGHDGRGSWSGITSATVVADQKLTASWPAAAGAVTYRCYLGYYYYGGRFTQFIETAGLTCDFTANPDWGTAPTTANITPGAAVPTFGMFATYAVSGIMPDGSETGLSDHVFGAVNPYMRKVRIDWAAVAGVDVYKIYRKPYLGAAWDRFWSVPSSATTFEDDHLASSATFPTGVLETTGIVNTVCVGETVIGGNIWQTFLVCGHAVKAIDAIFVGDRKQDLATVGANWLVPGTAEWLAAVGAAPYVDINGRRYTLIYGRGADAADVAAGTKALTVNLKGIEDAGDGSGAVITDGFSQYLHAMRNWILQDYSTGAWPTTGPTWPDSFGLGATEVLDDASFAEAAAVAAVRISGGYAGAFVIGSDGRQETVRTWIQRFNLSLDAFAGFNRNSQFFVRLINTDFATLAASRRFTQVLDIFAGSFKVIDRPADMENVISYNWGRIYAKQTWKQDPQEVSDADSITDYLQTKKSQTIDLWLHRNAEQAADVASRRLLRTKEIPRTVTFQTGLQATNTELGDIVRVTHLEGIGAGGWVDRAVFVTRHHFDPDRLTIDLEGIDVDRLFAGAFILGDETALPAWGAADAAERTYGYLCDETTEQFSDGAAGKRLR